MINFPPAEGFEVSGDRALYHAVRGIVDHDYTPAPDPLYTTLRDTLATEAIPKNLHPTDEMSLVETDWGLAGTLHRAKGLQLYIDGTKQDVPPTDTAVIIRTGYAGDAGIDIDALRQSVANTLRRPFGGLAIRQSLLRIRHAIPDPDRWHDPRIGGLGQGRVTLRGVTHIRPIMRSKTG